MYVTDAFENKTFKKAVWLYLTTIFKQLYNRKSKIIVGSKAYSIKTEMKYHGESANKPALNRILIKVYQTTILPVLWYGCETWYINREDIRELTEIQFTIIKTILKLSISTPKLALLGEIRDFPRELNIEERELMYLHEVITSKARINDISHIQIEEYSNNKENITNQNMKLLEKYDLNETKEVINLMKKSKWKKKNSRNKNLRKSKWNL